MGFRCTTFMLAIPPGLSPPDNPARNLYSHVHVPSNRSPKNCRRWWHRSIFCLFATFIITNTSRFLVPNVANSSFGTLSSDMWPKRQCLATIHKWINIALQQGSFSQKSSAVVFWFLYVSFPNAKDDHWHIFSWSPSISIVSIGLVCRSLFISIDLFGRSRFISMGPVFECERCSQAHLSKRSGSTHTSARSLPLDSPLALCMYN